MATTTSPRRQQTRDRLVEAAITLFAERSIEGSSVEEISERAGFTRGAFYSNFDSKDELCLEIVRQHGEHVLEHTRRALAAIHEGPMDDALHEGALAHLLAVLDVGITLDATWVLVREELLLYAYRHPSFRPAMIRAERETGRLTVEAIAGSLSGQGASLRIPIEQFLVTVDAFYERALLTAVLHGEPDAEHSLRDGLEKLVRALVVLPS